MRQILVTLFIVFGITACSLWVEPDPPLPITDSYATTTPTATVPPPLVLGLEIEATTMLIPVPTQTPFPLIDPQFDPKPFPWFDEPHWRWFPLTLP